MHFSKNKLIFEKSFFFYIKYLFSVPLSATFIFDFSLLHYSLHPVHGGYLNRQPLGHEPSALNSKPWLLALCLNKLPIIQNPTFKSVYNDYPSKILTNQIEITILVKQHQKFSEKFNLHTVRVTYFCCNTVHRYKLYNSGIQ
jgi:hypothetical protein